MTCRSETRRCKHLSYKKRDDVCQQRYSTTTVPCHIDILCLLSHVCKDFAKKKKKSVKFGGQTDRFKVGNKKETKLKQKGH